MIHALLIIAQSLGMLLSRFGLLTAGGAYFSTIVKIFAVVTVIKVLDLLGLALVTYAMSDYLMSGIGETIQGYINGIDFLCV